MAVAFGWLTEGTQPHKTVLAIGGGLQLLAAYAFVLNMFKTIPLTQPAGPPPKPPARPS
jgi:hypothetical protein